VMPSVVIQQTLPCFAADYPRPRSTVEFR